MIKALKCHICYWMLNMNFPSAPLCEVVPHLTFSCLRNILNKFVCSCGDIVLCVWYIVWCVVLNVEEKELGLKTQSAALVNVSSFSQLTQTKPKVMTSNSRMVIWDSIPLVLLSNPGSAHLQVSSRRSQANWPRGWPWGSHRVQCTVWLHPGVGPVGEPTPQEVAVEAEEERLEPSGLAAGGPAAPPVGSQWVLELQEQVQATLWAPSDLQEWVDDPLILDSLPKKICGASVAP